MMLQALDPFPGYGLNIAIIDSGIKKEHPAFSYCRIHTISCTYVTGTYDVNNGTGLILSASMVVCKVTDSASTVVDTDLVLKALSDILKWNENPKNDHIPIVVMSLACKACIR